MVVHGAGGTGAAPNGGGGGGNGNTTPFRPDSVDPAASVGFNGPSPGGQQDYWVAGGGGGGSDGPAPTTGWRWRWLHQTTGGTPQLVQDTEDFPWYPGTHGNAKANTGSGGGGMVHPR